jgi:predicted HicB family RNase H-like nuclease
MANDRVLMAKKKTYGTTQSGVPITDELVEKLAAQAERGFDVEEILRRRKGRPAMGSGPAKVESVRLDPELREALVRRAASDEEATSTVIRKALRKYLEH